MVNDQSFAPVVNNGGSMILFFWAPSAHVSEHEAGFLEVDRFEEQWSRKNPKLRYDFQVKTSSPRSGSNKNYFRNYSRPERSAGHSPFTIH